MATKPNPRKLSFMEIVMSADAEVIKAAYEARVKIDGLLTEREAAYQKILELENQVEAIIGAEGVFVYPPPPAPVAGIPKLDPAARKTAAPAAAAPKPVVKKTAPVEKDAATKSDSTQAKDK